MLLTLILSLKRLLKENILYSYSLNKKQDVVQNKDSIVINFIKSKVDSAMLIVESAENPESKYQFDLKQLARDCKMEKYQ